MKTTWIIISITAVFGLAVQAQDIVPVVAEGNEAEMPVADVQEPLTVSVTEEAVDLVAIEPEQIGTATVQEGLITLNVRGVELNNVIRIFTELSGANIIVPELAPELAQAKIDVNLTGVQWRPALQAVLSTLDLELYEQIPGSQVFSVRKQLPPAEAARFTQTFVFNHADISQAAEMIRGIVGDRGQVFAYSQGNAVVVKTTQTIMDDVAQVAERIDKPRQQVMIEARIMELSDRGRRARGAEFEWRNILTGSPKTEGPPDGGGSPFRGDLFFNALQAATGDYFDYAPGALGTLTLSASDFSLALKAINEATDSRIVSNPRVVVANGEQADIQILTKIPRVLLTRTTEQGQTTQQPTITYTATQDDDGEDPNTGRKRYAEYEFGIRLAVTPTVYTEDNIAVRIVPIISRRNQEDDFELAIDPENPDFRNRFLSIEEKRVETTFMLGNRRTAVIGGLTETSNIEYERKIPLLGDIPFIRHLFRYQTNDEIQRENIIFVTVSLEDGLDFDINQAVSRSPLTRQQLIREENNRIVDDHEIELFRTQQPGRVEEEIRILDRRHEAEARSRDIRKPFWTVLRPGSRPRP